jgi:hypothetical protein
MKASEASAQPCPRPRYGMVGCRAQLPEHPREIVTREDLTPSSKREILASRASDACAVDNAPTLRRIPGSGRVVFLDEILAALRALDERVDCPMFEPVSRLVPHHASESVRDTKRERQRGRSRGYEQSSLVGHSSDPLNEPRPTLLGRI